MQSSNKQLLADRLLIPNNTQALLWDMDGVLVNSLDLSFTVCNQLLAEHFSANVQISNAFIRAVFAYHPPEFWQFILQQIAEQYALPDALDKHGLLLELYEKAREQAIFPLNEGIVEILQAAQQQGIKMAVVSNNPTESVKAALQRAQILAYFNEVVGNDIETLQKKPAPDTYLLAAKQLAVNPQQCVVVEDSLIGVQAGQQAECFTTGVATGSADFAELATSGYTQQVYTQFAACHLEIAFGDVRQKHLQTPNDFVSHMLEHIAWRLCVSMDVQWTNNDWFELGQLLGQRIRQFDAQQDSAAALGMIDDGSAEVAIQLDSETIGLDLQTIETLDLDWFLGLRCEQLSDGKPLVELMQGLAVGLVAHLQVKVCSVQDPHHTWEGIFRSIGISLNQLFTPRHPAALPFDGVVQEIVGDGELQVLAKSLHYSKVFRGTAESHVMVAVDFSKELDNRFVFNVAPNIDVSQLPLLLEKFAAAAGFSLQVEYNATVLNSSHVVVEDTALVLGRALLEILALRMNQWGINGAGSSIQQMADIQSQPLHVGVSVEGRKFWIFVPFKHSYADLRQRFLLGQNVHDSLRSEDLDDFLDGLAGGLACSIIVHVHDLIDADQGWQLLFAQLGQSLQQVFALNPYRKGVPPGVKATLA